MQFCSFLIERAKSGSPEQHRPRPLESKPRAESAARSADRCTARTPAPRRWGSCRDSFDNRSAGDGRNRNQEGTTGFFAPSPVELATGLPHGIATIQRAIETPVTDPIAISTKDGGIVSV
jgi:hypothetical protein